jgi:esterase/lipase superfamily enzyme
MYGGDRGDLEYGFCEVSIPRSHTKGALDSPSILRLELRENPARHITLLTVQQIEFEAFKHTLWTQIARTTRKEAFVFVHGYNVTFKDAARRTAQLAYDLELNAVPLLYSWPSQGRLLAYPIDETNVEWTTAHLKQTLHVLMESCGIQILHLIGHSMGNRALANAVRLMTADRLQGSPVTSGHMILTAPDIDRDTFKQFGTELGQAAKRVTIYASSNDSALHLSRKFHGYARAGDTVPEVLLVNGVDTIDASPVNTSLVGHSYFAEDRSVLSDLFHLLRYGTAPEERYGLKSRVLNGLKYWSFQS